MAMSTRHHWQYGGNTRYNARHRKCSYCGATGRRIGYGSVPWDTQLVPDGPWHSRTVPPCPGRPFTAAETAAEKTPEAVQSPAPQVIDLTGVPADVSWSVEVLVPEGVIRVYAGMIEVRSGRRVSTVEIEPRRLAGYVTDTREKACGLEITLKSGDLS